MLTALLVLLAAQDHPPLHWTVTHTAQQPARYAEVQVVLIDADGHLLVDGWIVAAKQPRRGHTAFAEATINGDSGDGVVVMSAGQVDLSVLTPRGAPFRLHSLELERNTRTSLVLQLRGPNPTTSVYALMPYSSLELLGEGDRVVAVGRGQRVPMTPLVDDPRVWVASGLEPGAYEFEIDSPHLSVRRSVSCSTGEMGQVHLAGSSSLRLVQGPGDEPLRAARVFRRRLGGKEWARVGSWNSTGSQGLPKIRRLPAGDYTILVQYACGTRWAHEVPALGPAEERDVVLESPPTHDVEVQVVTATGEPVAHQPFSLALGLGKIPGATYLQSYAQRRFGDAAALIGTGSIKGTTDGNGRAMLEGVGLGAHAIEMRLEPWFSAQIPIDVAEAESVVRAVLPPTVDLEVLVEGARPTAFQEIVVWAVPKGQTVQLTRESERVVDGGGRCHFPRVPLGEMVFIVARRVGGGQQEHLLSETVEVDGSISSPLKLRVGER